MMERLFELFLKSGLQPLKIIPETIELEKVVNRSELSTLLIMHIAGEMTMSELAAKLGSPLSTITSLSKRLVQKGLIERNRNAKDQRIILIRLTDEGQKIAEQVKKIHQKILSRVQSALSDEELNLFIQLALKVVKALQEPDAQLPVAPKAESRKIPIDD